MPGTDPTTAVAQVAQAAQEPAVKTTGTEDGLTAIYKVNGEEVKLTAKMVQEVLLNGDDTLTREEIIRFIAMCKFNHLNPFTREAYVIKFKNNRGGNASATMVVSKDAYFKRAEDHQNYDGTQAGVIIEKDGEIREDEGCFIPTGWTLVGGWAKVYRSDRKYPSVSRVNLKDYDKGQSIWNQQKSTMISKIAKVHALRESFPRDLGGLYVEDEMLPSNPAERAPLPEAQPDDKQKAIGAGKAAAFFKKPGAEAGQQSSAQESSEDGTLFPQQQ
jgi:phage recombination protein Bet